MPTLNKNLPEINAQMVEKCRTDKEQTCIKSAGEHVLLQKLAKPVKQAAFHLRLLVAFKRSKCGRLLESLKMMQ